MKMTKYVAAAVLSVAGLTSGVSHAQSPASAVFDVNITLTAACSISAITALDFAYTSNQPGAQAATGGGLNVTCPIGLPYNFGLQSGAGAAVPPGVASIGPILDSVVTLNYTLTRPAAGSTGTGVAQPFTITGSMPPLQSGTCATASCTNAGATNRQHTLIVSF